MVFPGGHFGQSGSSIQMDDLNCNGTEIDVSDCQFQGWGQHNCGHNKDVGIECRKLSKFCFIAFGIKYI